MPTTPYAMYVRIVAKNIYVTLRQATMTFLKRTK